MKKLLRLCWTRGALQSLPPKERPRPFMDLKYWNKPKIKIFRQNSEFAQKKISGPNQRVHFKVKHNTSNVLSEKRRLQNAPWMRTYAGVIKWSWGFCWQQIEQVFRRGHKPRTINFPYQFTHMKASTSRVNYWNVRWCPNMDTPPRSARLFGPISVNG